VPPKLLCVQLPPEGSATIRGQRLHGAGVTVVSAFHNVAAHKLATDEDIDCDVLVFGDDKAARAKVVVLANQALTSILIFVNRTYTVDGAGIRITGIPEEPET
jgi:8-hydroxy-5-deazaflavin:NADPH oxidoreductase